jgi:NAD(P)-dependent dehydrogenase (short-subunit alcohol dehydrogenase family)
VTAMDGHPDPDAVPDYLSRLRLDGRHVAVLGAGAGIGRQAAHALAAAGGAVSCIDLDAAAAASVAAEVRGAGYGADATDPAALSATLEAVAGRDGPLAGVVDVIGGPRAAALSGHDRATWDRSLDLNVQHALLVMRLAPPHLAASASLAFVGSSAGVTGAPGRAGYGAAKAALLSLVKTAAIELGPAVRVNAVSPGLTWTPRVSQHRGEAERACLGARHPLGRVGEPADIAAALLFLISDLSSWITGQNLVVDGGISSLDPYYQPRPEP